MLQKLIICSSSSFKIHGLNLYYFLGTRLKMSSRYVSLQGSAEICHHYCISTSRIPLSGLDVISPHFRPSLIQDSQKTNSNGEQVVLYDAHVASKVFKSSQHIGGKFFSSWPFVEKKVFHSLTNSLP